MAKKILNNRILKKLTTKLRTKSKVVDFDIQATREMDEAMEKVQRDYKIKSMQSMVDAENTWVG